MVDIETHRIIDMIKSREYDDVVKWLRAYPYIQVVSRDGSVTYHKAITDSHPQAIQVSDRFHLLKNLTDYAKDYLRKIFNQHVMIDALDKNNEIEKEDQQKSIINKADENRKLTLEEKFKKVLKILGEGKPITSACKDASLDIRSYNRLFNLSEMERDKVFSTKPMGKHEENLIRKMQIVANVRDLKVFGLSIREINRRTGVSRGTIKKYLADNYNPVNASYRNKKNGKLIPYLEEINSYLEQGVMGAVIEKKIREKGYNGSSSNIRHYIADWKRCGKKEIVSNNTGSKKEMIKRMNIIKLLYHPLEKVKAISEEQFIEINKGYPDFQKIYELIWKFRKILKEKRIVDLEDWIKEATNLNISEITSFINGIKRDMEAVRNAVTLGYSNGLAEGKINKLKVIKRIMYGRCGFETLRTKTLRLEIM